MELKLTTRGVVSSPYRRTHITVLVQITLKAFPLDINRSISKISQNTRITHGNFHKRPLKDGAFLVFTSSKESYVQVYAFCTGS